eukprot:gene26973-33169_t
MSFIMMRWVRVENKIILPSTKLNPINFLLNFMHGYNDETPTLFVTILTRHDVQHTLPNFNAELLTTNEITYDNTLTIGVKVTSK